MLTKNYLLLLCGCALLLLAACSRPPDYPLTPAIQLISMTPLTVRADKPDSIVIKLSFTDGDGDITPIKGQQNIFIKDPRTFSFLPRFRDTAASFIIPTIEDRGVSRAISGEIKLLFLPQTACEYEPGTTHPTTDKVAYKIYMEDKAGNKSNTLQLPEVTITECQ